MPEGEDNSYNKPTGVDQPGAVTQSAGSASAEQTVRSQEVNQPIGKKKRKSGLIIGVVVAVLCLILVGGGVSAYAFWYQNPERVLSDALFNLPKTTNASINGSVLYSDDEGSKVTINFDGRSDTNNLVTANIQAKIKVATDDLTVDTDVEAEVVLEPKEDEMNLYFKLSNIKGLLQDIAIAQLQAQTEPYRSLYSEAEFNRLMKAAEEQVEQNISKIAGQLDDKWFKTSTANDSSAASNESYKCVVEAFQSIENDEASRHEIAVEYQQHQFIETIDKLGSRGGSLGYALEINMDKAAEFGEAIEETDFVKRINDCDASAEKTSSDSGDIDNQTDVKKFEVWVSRWSHQLTGLEIEVSEAASDDGDDQQMTVKLNFDYSDVPEVDIPSDATDVNDIQDLLNADFEESATSQKA